MRGELGEAEAHNGDTQLLLWVNGVMVWWLNAPKAQSVWEANVELSVATRREGAHTIISVTGEIDVYTAPTLRERLNEVVAHGQYQLIVDMAGVDFLDSTGLGVLVGGLKRARSHEGSLQLVCDQEKILKVFRITGLTKVFPIHASLAEALANGA